MKRLSTWDTYVQEALKDGDRAIELPLTEDESYVINYPTRRQGREIAKAQREGDTDALLVAMLGEEAGARVRDLSDEWPAFVLDEFLVDVMKKFGMIPDDTPDETSAPAKPTAARNGRAPGKAPVRRKSTSASKR